MKRFWISFCAVVLCIALTACSGKTSLPSDFSLGTVNGRVYENAYIGLGCNLPSDFIYATSEELDDLNETSAEMTEDERKAVYTAANTIYLMQANNEEGGGIGINLENTNAEGAQVTSARQYLTTAKTELPSAMEQMGFADVTIAEEMFSFGDKKYNGLQVIGYIFEEKFIQNYICYEVDQYLVILSYGAYGEEVVQSLTDAFYSV